MKRFKSLYPILTKCEKSGRVFPVKLYMKGDCSMKKTAVIFLCLILTLSVFVSCGKEAAWEANEYFKSLTNYSEGEVISADFSTSCSVKIKDNNYENFRKYVEKMKKDGFEYLPFGSAPENYELSNGSALWRCTNGKIYLQLMFNEDGTNGAEAFGCNIQIFGYNEMPESWKPIEENKAEKDKDKKSDKADVKDTESKSTDNK